MTAQELQSLKNKYDIIGNDPALNRALEIAVAVAPTDLTVLIFGESGVGKENIPKIIHQYSRRRTGKYFAINCGAIPEGTIDSELFGHEKGSFTGANEMRKGYFEEADGGTLFLDEIGELPMASQAKLLRVLQSGEFIRVGSSKVLKTDVRVVAATNVNLMHAVSRGKFREDLYYRLNAVSVLMPALRERRDDIYLLFRKFTSDFSEKYGMNKVTLTPDAVALLKNYRWPGNIRQLKNVAETVSALESSRISPVSGKCELNAETLSGYIPKDVPNMLPVRSSFQDDNVSPGEREAIIRMIYQLRQEVDYLKGVVLGTGKQESVKALPQSSGLPDDGFVSQASAGAEWQEPLEIRDSSHRDHDMPDHVPQFRDTECAKAAPDDQDGDDLSLQKAGTDLIRKALEKYHGNRKQAAAELGISERTLYRKLKSIEEN
ncbi:MAG: sigma-54-dependent Fis family transcriptional regulator [Bacteroidetes bacterium]|uniref:Sigma-54-dependent Fis family transcriptional regulator n=1 Tax=Candidatus Cryptobacteroides excrementipullorum TaxID=2840761 RepID=A0A9D9NMI6_9BACT|nr:sigma-54-dependent Fis family transcriptional regulator [Candidatus Cryptobacteroides excrementipullorum]